MSNPTRHYIVTRFNVHDTWQRPDNWLSERTDIFREYTLQSVKRQTVLPDKWLLLVKSSTSKSLITYLESLWSIIKVVICSNTHREVLTTREFIRRDTCNNDRIIMTLLDSDDCLRRNFCEHIQETARLNVDDTYIIDIEKWFRLDIQHNTYCLISANNRRIRGPHSRSIMYSIVTNANEEPFIIPDQYGHGRIGEIIDGLVVIDCPGLQIAHKNNQLITIYESSPSLDKVTANCFYENFGIITIK